MLNVFLRGTKPKETLLINLCLLASESYGSPLISDPAVPGCFCLVRSFWPSAAGYRFSQPNEVKALRRNNSKQIINERKLQNKKKEKNYERAKICRL